MQDVEYYKQKVIDGYKIDKIDALNLLKLPLNDLTNSANDIRQHFCGNNFDACTIINVKNGKCSEDCKFCAQSVYNNTDISSFPLLTKQELKSKTLDIYKTGFKRISYVSSGRKINEDELKNIGVTIKELKDEHKDIKICVSLGLLSKKQIELLEVSGIDRLHNNLETSEEYFKQICTTHTYEDKLNCLNLVNNDNLKICSGGIFGVGESFEDRINLALKLRELNVKSIPINILNPIKGTPLEDFTILSNEELCKIVAIFRFINPSSYIRLAGGRLLLEDYGRKAFKSGANAAIMGDMLTTKGVQYNQDIKMIKELGYQISYDIN